MWCGQLEGPTVEERSWCFESRVAWFGMPLQGYGVRELSITQMRVHQVVGKERCFASCDDA